MEARYYHTALFGGPQSSTFCQLACTAGSADRMAFLELSVVRMSVETSLKTHVSVFEPDVC